jgi:hypothetical protein
MQPRRSAHRDLRIPCQPVLESDMQHIYTIVGSCKCARLGLVHILSSSYKPVFNVVSSRNGSQHVPSRGGKRNRCFFTNGPDMATVKAGKAITQRQLATRQPLFCAIWSFGYRNLWPGASRSSTCTHEATYPTCIDNRLPFQLNKILGHVLHLALNPLHRAAR